MNQKGWDLSQPFPYARHWKDLKGYLTLSKGKVRILGMDKETVKSRLLDALKDDPHLVDIKSAAVFGSFVRGEAREDSDIDVLIDFVPSAVVGYFELARIQRNLCECLGRRVDLLTPEAVSKFFRDDVLREAEFFYEG